MPAHTGSRRPVPAGSRLQTGWDAGDPILQTGCGTRRARGGTLVPISAEQGLPEAQFNLAALYALGKGVSQDYVVAYQWLCLAAAASDSNAVAGKQRLATRLSTEEIEQAQQRAAAWKLCGTPEECRARLTNAP